MQYGIAKEMTISLPTKIDMKPLVTLSLLFILTSCSEKSEPEPSMKKTLEVGDYVFVNKEQASDETYGTSKPITKTITIDKIKYQIVLNSHGDTIYMATRDPRLITEEGYKIGTQWSEIDKKHQNKLQKEMGYAFTIRLDSKWQLAFCEGEKCTSSTPVDTSTVDWIFYKRQ